MKDDRDFQEEVGHISNYYGGLNIKKEDGVYFWGIENCDGIDWEEIPKSLFEELVKFVKIED